MRVAVCLLCLVLTCVSASDLDVRIRQGKLRGHRLTTRKGREFLAFQGIPYAKPAVGELRFKRSLPADGWDGVRNASVESAECIQMDVYFQETEVKGQEDCLYINVYTPKLRKVEELLPVMVFIHGGGWLSGSGSSFLYGGNYLLDKDVVLVTFNYRLGPLGFLSTGDEVCPGNNGLKDQVLALEWVRDNVAQFAGNPGRVTIFGQSAGAASTHYHMLSPLSQGLFHGAISQSGTSLAPWAIASSEIAVDVGRKLATLLDCPTQTSDEMVDCLRLKTAEEIFNTDPHFREWNLDPGIPFRPVTESGPDAFIPGDPLSMIRDPSRVANVPYMAGFTSGEGAIAAASVFYKQHLLQELSTNFDKLAPLILFYRETAPDPDSVTQRIKKFYFQDRPITNDSRYTVVDMYSDAYFNVPVDKTIRLHATVSTAPVFYYYFDYRLPVSFSSVYGDPTRLDYGVCHGDDLQFLFPMTFMLPEGKFNEKDSKIADLLTTLWTDFAKTGSPTPPGHKHTQWSHVEPSHLQFMHIGSDGEMKMAAVDGVLKKRMDFWASLPLTDQLNVRDEL